MRWLIEILRAQVTRIVFLIVALLAATAGAQSPTTQAVTDALEKGSSVSLFDNQVTAAAYDYVASERPMEAILFRPAGDGPFPAILLIPGHARAARDLIERGADLAKNGFVAVAVSQPGYGRSRGPADYVGPMTINALGAAIDKMKAEKFVDAKRIGVYGYSRGGMAASLLAVQRDDIRAAVLGAGIYDFKTAREQTKIQDIRENMDAEAGTSDQAADDRSSIRRVSNLKCPVLILHGEKDENVSVQQAIALRDELQRLGKEFEFKLYPDKAHSIGTEEVQKQMLDFFSRRLK